MRHLIDGYNLLHAMGVLQGRAGPHGLEQARQALLGLLAGAWRDKPSDLTVVFDAADAPRGVSEVAEYRGIRVRYATGHQEADDLIELLIQRESSPRRLAVVSDDRRIQTAARRRRCTVLACAEFLTVLGRQRRRRQPTKASEPEKPTSAADTQVQHWTQEFAALQDDPAWKELFDAYDFERENLQP